MASAETTVTESHYDLIRDAIFDNDRARAAELLAAPGVDVDHFDAGGQTLLHLACFWGRMDLCKLLLNAGASLKTKNAAGCTALDLATHWGHSAVAEVIRLRGGSSVWEDKLGSLQVELEDLTLRAAQLKAQSDDKTSQLDALTHELQSLQTQLVEEKSAHALCMNALQRTRQQRADQDAKLQELECERSELSRQLKAALVAQDGAERASERAQEQMGELRAHRDEILAQMQGSVRKQEEAAHCWQRAEVAAAMADSQRNFAFAERDQIHRAHGAALGELVITTERLGAAEEELMTLKTDLAEHIYEMNREKRMQKRAARALSPSRGDGGLRPNTTPVEMPAGDTHTHKAPTKRSHKPEEVQLLLQTAKAKPRTQFSLAAREFGMRTRAEEQQKLRDRTRRLQRVENQYFAHGLRAPVVGAELFQEEFVSTVRAFASARSDKWQRLKRERDRQARFAANALARPLTTGPQLSGGTAQLQHAVGLRPHTLNYTLYGKYSSPLPKTIETGDGRSLLRPATSCTELRMQESFLSEAAAKIKTLDVDPLKHQVVPSEKGDSEQRATGEATKQLKPSVSLPLV